MWMFFLCGCLMMAIFRNLHKAPKTLASQGTIVVIGNFDGLHLGHQALIAKANFLSEYTHMPVCVVTFEPSPTAYFNKKYGKGEIHKIQRFYDKAEFLKALDIDHVFCLSFNDKLANLSATAFLDQLTKYLGAKHFCVGDDFHFGKNREGDCGFLQAYAIAHNQSTYIMPSMIDNQLQRRISSTMVRELLIQGNLSEVSRLLGRNYTFSGKVCFGAARGRQIGFQTANISLTRYPLLLHGVYAVKVVAIENQKTDLLGVASVGTNPTVSDIQNKILEIHMLDYNDNLYGKRLKVEFLAKIRDEMKFPDLPTLAHEINNDIIKARMLF